MYIDLADLFWLMLVSLAILLWYRNLQARERALREAQRYCAQLDLQLLDQTISLKRVRLKRDQDGWLKLFRAYQFEFSSTGDERYKGELWMLGQRVQQIDTQAYRLNE